MIFLRVYLVLILKTLLVTIKANTFKTYSSLNLAHYLIKMLCVYIRVYSRLDFYIGAFKAKYNFELWLLHKHRCLIYQFFVCSIHYSHCSDSTGQKSSQSHLYALKWSKKDFTLLHIYFSNLLTPNIWQTQLWSARSKLNMWQKIIFLA